MPLGRGGSSPLPRTSYIISFDGAYSVAASARKFVELQVPDRHRIGTPVIKRSDLRYPGGSDIMPIMKKEAQYYAKLLPQRISVKIEKDEKGLWAKILELPHCYTQASSGSELLEMINDAVQTHFEIPEKFRKDIGYYVPITDQHQRLEEMFRKLVEIEQKVSAGVDVETTFNLSTSAVC